jgi:hypothetical protein
MCYHLAVWPADTGLGAMALDIVISANHSIGIELLLFKAHESLLITAFRNVFVEVTQVTHLYRIVGGPLRLC